MKKFDKEIDQLRKIERGPEEAAMLQSIDGELKKARRTREQLENEKMQLRAEYNRTVSKSREDQITARLQKIREELEALRQEENRLSRARENVFGCVQEKKRSEAEKRLEEIREELKSLQVRKQEAHNNFDKELFDQLAEKEQAAGEEMAELMTIIRESRTAVSEMTAAARELRAKMQRQTAAEAVKLFDQLKELTALRRLEEAEIRSIEDAYNNRTANSYITRMFFDPYNELRRGLENNHNLIEELRREAAGLKEDSENV